MGRAKITGGLPESQDSVSREKRRVLRNVSHFPGSLGTSGILTRDVSPASQQMWPMNKHPCGAREVGGITNMKKVVACPSVSPSPAPRAADTLAGPKGRTQTASLGAG